MRRLGLLLAFALVLTGATTAAAHHTPSPSAVTIAGSLQSEAGCIGDWIPDCAVTHLSFDPNDDVWQGTFSLPAGDYEYKAPLNNGWDENYGLHAVANGANVMLHLGAARSVKFYYSHDSHWVTDDVNSTIAVAPGSFQSELGCSGDWDPGCLRSWLQDVDGDGTYTLSTTALPPGSYEFKVAINESWDENYGAGGISGGPNMAFTVAQAGSKVEFAYDATTHQTTTTVTAPPPVEPPPPAGGPAHVTVAGSLQSELGCPGDWDPACAATHLFYDAGDDVWQRAFTVPGGDYEYKAPLNDSWDENYGRGGVRDGANIALHLAASRAVKFYYDHKSHWITDNVNSVIAVAPGSFQSELGCAGDWDPGCLRSWLQDADGDGVYRFETTALPPGSYETKVAINESWDENYGAGGSPGGANIPFTVNTPNSTVRFAYDASTHVLTVTVQSPGPTADNNVEWDGLGHDSRDTLYRTPGGAVPAGTPVKLRFRTFHDDVTSVKVRVYDLNASTQQLLPMTRAATDVSCYSAALAGKSCDFWQAEITRTKADNLWYRFVVTDGTDTDYYGDDTFALDGGSGSPTDEPVDISYSLMFFEPGFTTPAWTRNAVIYQVFPDRFRNGDAKNDPKTGDTRYDDPVLKLPWNTKPEGYCRSYADASGATCPWRYDAHPPAWSPTVEGPRGRDYMGGDLAGVTQKLDYLKDLGVNTIYFNPIFESKSNHGYDTANYRKLDKYFGKEKDWKDLTAAANARGIRIILDGVFNHMSSDSAFFDRYHHYDEVGACESTASQWRSWFTFTTQNVPCTGSDYVGWFGFDSIPVLTKSLPAVQDYFVRGKKSVAVDWLSQGAAGWRLDVMGDSSFPNGYWETFRTSVKATDPNAVIIGELWQKDSTTLRYLRGDRADSTMNYRLRDAVLGLLAPQGFDGKGFGDSGRRLSPAEAASRLASIYEDYPRAVSYALMNLLDSHDTARLLWQLTPGQPTTADKELNAANVSEGKQRQRLASLIQFVLPGSPTIYYGDEVGVTGADDPDDRRTYPWADTGGTTDAALLAHYRGLSALRRAVPALGNASADTEFWSDARVLAVVRRDLGDAAVAAVNGTFAPGAAAVPVSVPDGTLFRTVWGGTGTATVVDGKLPITVGPLSGVVLEAVGDFAPPNAPTGLRVTDEGNGSASVAWNAVPGAAAYRVYRSPLSGGGYVRAGETTGTTFADTGLRNARTYYYVVRALDSAGNESGGGNEVAAIPHASIGYAVVQWPKSISWTISIDGTENVYGQVYVAGMTDANAPPAEIRAQGGFGPAGSSPAAASWTWLDAAFNTRAGSNYEYVTRLFPETTGSFEYAYRFSTDGGHSWVYGDADGVYPGNGYDHPAPLTVNASSDTTAPATPAGLHRVSSSPNAIEIAWTAVSGDASLYGYEVLRDGVQIARVTGTSFVDATVDEGQTYAYAVRSVDRSVNRSAASASVSIKAELRIVTVTFEVTVPASTDATGRAVHIAGTLSRLQDGLPEWDPAATSLTRVDATHWRFVAHGYEGTQLEYKFTLGDWDHVEKDTACGEIANRQATLAYGTGGTQTVNDTVANWRNVAPCGN
jgi:glycosidase